MQKIERHIPVLDGVRGLAIAMILVTHTLNGSKLQLIQDFAGSMWTGVDLFFVLSGYLITGILYDTRNADGYFRTFYMRRFLRIFPLYYGFLFLLIALTQPLRFAWNGRQFIYLAYLQNTGLAHNLTDQPLSPLVDINHFWSLAVEEQFYLVWPAVIFLIKDRRKLIWATILLAASSIGTRLLLIALHAGYNRIYIFTPARADSLMIGALLALLMHSTPETRNRVIRSAPILLPCCLSLLVWMAWPGALYQYSLAVSSFGYTIIALAAASLLAMSIANPALNAFFSIAPLRFLGKYSYGIYVIHLPVSTLCNRLDLAVRFWGPDAGDFARVLVTATANLLSIGLAVLSFHFYESRFLVLKRHFSYNFSAPSEAASRASPRLSVP